MIRFSPPILFATLLVVSHAQAATGDRWLERTAAYPWEIGSAILPRESFVTLKAEVLIGKLNVFWRAAAGLAEQTVTLHYSADYPGHWTARDWRPISMRKRGNLFDAKLPVADLDVPIVYYLSIGNDGRATISPPRVLHPRTLGMEAPSTLFWPFLEGFEAERRNWSSVNNVALSQSQPHNGLQSLRVSIPTGKRSASVHTTRVRGWYFRQRNATGLKIWLKASKPDTKVRFKLTSNHGTERAEVTPSSREARIGPQWQLVELPFSTFSVTTPGEVDLFSLEFVKDGPVEIHLDDLELTGQWRIYRRH